LIFPQRSISATYILTNSSSSGDTIVGIGSVDVPAEGLEVTQKDNTIPAVTALQCNRNCGEAVINMETL
jgi:hypothetical protein